MLQTLRRLTVGLLAVCAVGQIGGHDRLRASTSGIVISQVYGGGGNSGATLKNDFIELFNASASPVDVTGWTVQYASSTGSSWQKTTLSGIVQSGHYYLVQEAAGTGGTVSLPTPDASGSIAMSATSGKVALVNNSTTLTGTCPTSRVDFVGFGTANCSETSPTAALSNTTAAIRKNGGLIDTDNNAADFVVGAPTPRNSHGGDPTLSVAPILLAAGDPILLTVKVTPGTNPTSTGITVTGNLAAIGGSAAQAFSDDGSNGDLTPGDGIYSFAPPFTVAAGTFALPISASDAQGRSATATLPVTVAQVLAIHDIQGASTVSPYVSQAVATTGIVTGVKYNGFFIQTPDIDGDSNTSEGVFVYTGSTPPDVAVVGNLVRVLATVSEYKSTSSDPDGLSMTELTGPIATLLSSGHALPAAMILGPSDLDPAGSIFALEKYEGMRVHVDAVTSTSPTDGTVNEANATSISSGIFFGVLQGTARPFREPGIETPLPIPPEAPAGVTPPVFDANPERIGVDTFSVFADPATAAIYPPPAGSTLEVTSNVVVSNITGPLEYANRSYIIDAEGWNMPSADSPNLTVQAVRPRASDEFTVATMNLARFFDTIDNAGISDVALTPAAFQLRLAKASLAIRDVMGAPDVIGVEEVENLATLQQIADKVYDDSATALDYAAYLFEGNDIGGIDVGFLVRKDRIAVSSVEQYGKDTVFEFDGSLLNDRPSLILHGVVDNPPYDPYPIAVLVNHLRSMSGIDGSDGVRIRAKRLAQAVDLANELQALQASGEHVVSVGDYNAFDVNDGYVDVMGLLEGTEADPAQVTLWAESPVTPPLFDLIGLAPANHRYSFLFDGNAQEIDHILASAGVIPNAIDYGRMNADFPESLRGDATRPERLSDHDPIVGYFAVPDNTPPVLTLPPDTTVEGNTRGGATVTFAVAASDNVDGNIAPVCAPASGALFGLGTTTVTCSATDAHGNRVNGSFTVTVIDTTPPVINAVTPSTTTLWAPNHKMVPVSVAVEAKDIVDPAPSCRIAGVTANDGAAPADWTITGPLTLSLRAERTGGGDGRTYTIGVQCVDGSGNVSAPASTGVTVPHDQRK